MTVVTSKSRRVTFFECPNDLNAMIDLAKIADLALLMVDGAYGFEMETFEFLNILQVGEGRLVRALLLQVPVLCPLACCGSPAPPNEKRTAAAAPAPALPLRPADARLPQGDGCPDAPRWLPRRQAAQEPQEGAPACLLAGTPLCVHAPPAVLLVLSSLPQEMKQRFWQEIHQGAKLFYLSGLIHGGYPKMEVHNLALYIARMKARGGERGRGMTGQT